VAVTNWNIPARPVTGPAVHNSPRRTAWALVSAGVFHNKPMRSIGDVSLRAERCARLDSYIQQRRLQTRPDLAENTSMAEQPGPDERPRCCICFDDTIALPLRCDADPAHSMCAECAAHIVVDGASRPPMELSIEESRTETYMIVCPVPGCKSHPFVQAELAAALTDDAGMQAVSSLAQASERLVKMLRQAETTARDDDMIRSQFALPDGGYSAYMCGACSFGPIEHVNCHDLSAHHGERRGGSIRVNNACPACGWFARDLGQWKRWDGRVVGQPASADRVQHEALSSTSPLAAEVREDPPRREARRGIFARARRFVFAR